LGFGVEVSKALLRSKEIRPCNICGELTFIASDGPMAPQVNISASIDLSPPDDYLATI